MSSIVDKFIENNKNFLPTKFDEITEFKEYKKKIYKDTRNEINTEKKNEENIYDNIGIKEIKSNNNKEIDIKWYDITKSDHPLWINENTLPKRLTRFVDERYILTDTNEYSQKIMVVLGLIIIIITIIELYIREFKNDKYKIKETNIQLKLTLSVLKIFSSFAFLYYFIPNLILRTSKPNDDTIQLDKNI